MKLRLAKIDELDRVYNLRKETILNVNAKSLPKKHIDYLLDLNSKENILNRIKENRVYVAIEDNKIIGTIEYFKGEISGFYIDSTLVGKGYGKKMISSMEKLAKKNKEENISIICNISSIGFYKKNGFELKEEKDFKEGEKDEKVYLLKKDL